MASELSETEIDRLRIVAFKSNAPDDRQAYFEAASKWFQDRHYRAMNDTNELEAARVLSQEGGLPVSAAVELARAASDLLATTTDERQVPSIWLPRVDRLRAAISKATS